jgi:hypothetical protein
MKITTDKTKYLLVTAGDSQLSGTDYAVIVINKTLLVQLNSAKEILGASKGSPGRITIQMMDNSCTYLEVEKLNESLFQHIEQLQDNERWKFGYIDQELYNELIETCAIETSYSGNLNVSSDSFSFELYDEASSDGLYLIYRTEDIPISTVI